jgi:hypothetical protein
MQQEVAAMPVPFRPRVESLEAREVPAALSFQLPDGSIGSGLFATPVEVDPAESFQTFILDGELTVTKGGVAYTVQPGAVANYSNGMLYGVQATAVGPDVIQIDNIMVNVGGSPAPVVYDAADTMMTFTLSDGTVGAVSYAVPWDDVDASSVNDSVSPLNFRLNIAGRNIDTGTPGANFTVPPALHLEYGECAGLTFELDTQGLQLSGFPYTSFSAAFNLNGDNLITVIKAGVGQLQPSQILAERPQVTFNFNTGANDTKDTVLPTGTTIRIHVTAGEEVYDYNGTTVAGETVGDVVQQVYENMKTAGWDVALLPSGKGLIVNGALKYNEVLQRNQVIRPEKAGINYSTAAQPVGPKAIGSVQLLILDDGEWKPKPKPE